MLGECDLVMLTWLTAGYVDACWTSSELKVKVEGVPVSASRVVWSVDDTVSGSEVEVVEV